MPIRSEPPGEFAELFSVERRRLLEVLRGCDAQDWTRPTACPAWNVLGLAVHLLGGDFSLLAAQRDGHLGTPAPSGLSEDGFIAWIDEVMVEWVHAARRLSGRLVVDLLDWTGPQVASLIASQDPTSRTAHVSWASTDVVPCWLDQARELSERWIHRQQLLEALDHPTDLRADLAEPVLDAFRWAYPRRLGALARPGGSTVEIAVTGPELRAGWLLVSDGTGWDFSADAAPTTIAALRGTDDQIWRLLTNNLRPEHGTVDTTGDPTITAILMRTRAIIGTPK